MREMIEAIKEIWNDSIKAREYQIGKHIYIIKPFSITIKKNK